MSDDEEREALTSRMQSAGTLSEMDAVIDEARRWFREHPGDERVATAMQRLEERKERREDTEKVPNWASVVVFGVVALVSWVVVYVLSGNWVLSILVGAVLGMEVAWWTWETTLAFVESTRRDRNSG